MLASDFEQLLTTYPDVILERRWFVGLLKDYFPRQPSELQLLLSAYDLGLASTIHKIPHINHTFADRYVQRLMTECGASPANAKLAVSLWCVCYGAHALGKSCEVTLGPDGIRSTTKKADTPVGTIYGDLFSYQKSASKDGLAVHGFSGKSQRTVVFQSYSAGKKVTEVAEDAFADCDIEEAIFTEGFRRMGKRSFARSKKLRQVVLPISVREISDGAFWGCTNLSNVALPQLLEVLGAYSLSGTGIKNVTIPKSVRIIGEGAFANCTAIKKLDIPDNISALPDSLFAGCIGLHRVDLHERMTEIGARTFFGCTGLESIYIPDSVIKIGEEAFANVHKNFVMLCGFGSYAESYARENQLPFQFV